MPIAPTVIVNLAMHQGEDKLFQDTIYQSNGTTLQNLTGWSVQMIVHAVGNPSNTFITKSGTITTPASGIVEFTVSASDTASLYTGQYEYYIIRTNSGSVAIPTKGMFSLLNK